MAKKLRVRDKLLLGLAVAGDLYFEIFEPYGIQTQRLRGFLPPDYKVTNFTNTISRMLRTGRIEKIVKRGEPYFRLSHSERDALTRDFPILKFARRPWDHFWRIVFYDIPEGKRGIRVSLQRKLIELGFGKLQESTYVSPFDLAEDIREYLSTHNLEDWVFVSVSRRLFAGNEQSLAEKVWGLSQLNQRYQEWLNSDRNYSEYLEILKDDPCLPKELLPKDWLGDRAKRTIKEILVS